MFELFVSEWERMWARKKTVVTLVLFAAVSVLAAMWLSRFGVGFVNAGTEVRLDAWNFPAFLLKETSFVLMLVAAPMLFVDALAGERVQGAYRMVLLRPHGRGALLLAKWVALAVWVAMLLAVVLAVGVIAGQTWLGDGGALTERAAAASAAGLASFGDVLAYYGVFYLIAVAAMGLCTLICLLVPSTVLAYAGLVGSYVGMLYVSEHLRFFLLGGEAVFQVLSGNGAGVFAMALGSVMVLSFGASWVMWKKRELC
ncbi:ABC transporter permease subunit [Tumebacillus sp. DT12]|uniref:ABC transporter permease subunit n=1 Tax=Tumebacillus lacus TaxID=2995335 RepID=A0ABT3X3M0_9BACL|nr:ABC transporter permease subunit [Tumebacillus lacus]MCX7569344.1 ABC transporter permease subunit [Tumebacillus lacus]